MSFKIHLIIVSCIIVVVYFVWQWIAAPEPLPAAPKNSPYSIAIVHASWGLNCHSEEDAQATGGTDGFASDPNNPTNSLHEDNALASVSALCNGKLQCVIPANSETLGKDPAPDCLGKELAIEYRCFSYDRPWSVKSFAQTAEINCDKAVKRE